MLYQSAIPRRSPRAACCTTPLTHLPRRNRDPHLLALALTSTTSLLSTLYALPTRPSALGPIIDPPPPTTLLPREKHLPKPKPPTKWERFAAEKGISHKTREREVWDEARQEWVARWGKGGKNKEVEEQWIQEIKPGSGRFRFYFFEESQLRFPRTRCGSGDEGEGGEEDEGGEERASTRREPRRRLFRCQNP